MGLLDPPVAPAVLAASSAFTSTYGRRPSELDARDYGTLQDALDAGESSKQTVYVPAGTYLVSVPLVFKTSIRGAGPGVTIIKRNSSFTGSCVLDFNHATESKRVSNLTMDGSGYDTQLFGSSGDASGSSKGFFDRVHFIQTGSAVYAVGGASVGNAGGMLTGSTFLNCEWTNCSAWIAVGQNQDDVTLLGCRFKHVAGGGGMTGPSVPPILMTGQNITMQSTYMYLKSSTAAGAVKSIFQFGSLPVAVRGLFIESDSGANWTHLFEGVNPDVRAQVEDVRMGANLTSLAAAFRVNLAPTTNQATVAVRGLASAYTVPFMFDVNATDTTGTKLLSLSIDGSDSVSAVLGFTAGSTVSKSKVCLSGVHRGVHYAHYARPNAAPELLALPGPVTYVVRDDFESRADGVALGVAPTGQTWVTAGGTFVINGGRAQQTPIASPAIAYVATGMTNVLVSTVLPTVSGDGLGLIARVVDANNLYATVCTSSGDVALYKRVGGTYTQLGSTANSAWVAGDTHSLYVKGATIEARINGKTVCSATDGALTASTNCGLRAAGTTGTPAWESFSVQAV